MTTSTIRIRLNCQWCRRCRWQLQDQQQQQQPQQRHAVSRSQQRRTPVARRPFSGMISCSFFKNIIIKKSNFNFFVVTNNTTIRTHDALIYLLFFLFEFLI
eukprot:PhM_4_TR18756/c1_g1_i1/m.55561